MAVDLTAARKLLFGTASRISGARAPGFASILRGATLAARADGFRIAGLGQGRGAGASPMDSSMSWLLLFSRNSRASAPARFRSERTVEFVTARGNAPLVKATPLKASSGGVAVAARPRVSNGLVLIASRVACWSPRHEGWTAPWDHQPHRWRACSRFHYRVFLPLVLSTIPKCVPDCKLRPSQYQTGGLTG